MPLPKLVAAGYTKFLENLMLPRKDKKNKGCLCRVVQNL